MVGQRPDPMGSYVDGHHLRCTPAIVPQKRDTPPAVQPSNTLNQVASLRFGSREEPRQRVHSRCGVKRGRATREKLHPASVPHHIAPLKNYQVSLSVWRDQDWVASVVVKHSPELDIIGNSQRPLSFLGKKTTW